MPGRIPRPIGGVSGFYAGDDIGAEERQLRASFGEGVYSPAKDSGHGRLRMVFAAALAVMDAADWRIWRNSLPDCAIEWLEDWETQLGLEPAPTSWTLDQRWSRLRARCLEFRGNNPKTLELIFGELTGATCYCSETDGYPLHDERNGACVAMILPQSAWDDQTIWIECERTRDRVEPAHGRIFLSVTHDGGTPHRHPVFRSDESLTDRDCTRPD